MLGMTVSTAVGICIFCLGFAALNLYIERSAISVCVVYALGARVGNGDVSFSGRKDTVDAHARQPRTQIYGLKNVDKIFHQKMQRHSAVACQFTSDSFSPFFDYRGALLTGHSSPANCFIILHTVLPLTPAGDSILGRPFVCAIRSWAKLGNVPSFSSL